jgi:AcrR family transcriptional regulator
MTTPGLRERKKARTRQIIADAAARLFAARGYEQVAVSEVARAAEVSEQTVYNYFQTKEQLVTDRDQQVQDELCRRIRARTRNHAGRSHPRLRARHRRGDPPRSRRAAAR